MDGINTWWREVRGERFWLGIPDRGGDGEWLAAPCAVERNSPVWRTPSLITHVMDGDVVFHYDETRQAIVAWSTSRGRARRKRMAWSRRTPGPRAERAASHLLPSWVIDLEPSTPLDGAVAADQIARTQWDRFPALRAFEDRVGEPLYYPFTMGSPTGTRLLPGHVFKLPALFVEWFPALARVAEGMRWSTLPRTSVADRAMASVGV